MARNITSGKSGRQISEVLGLKELKAKVKKLNGALVADEAQGIVGSAGRHVSAEIRHGAESANVPHEVFANIFSYSKPQVRPSGRAAKVSALAGIRKRGKNRPFAVSYAEWRNRAAYTRLRGKGRGKARTFKSGGVVAVGELIGENLGTMWEIGTSKRPATPFFRPAVQRAQARVLMILKDGYSALIERHAKANP